METEQVKAVATGQQLERIEVEEADRLSALCQEIYAQYYPVSYTHLDVYKRQPSIRR